jgi:hypothetical protein
MTRGWLLFVLALSACGPAAPPADEVTEEWTSGDDEPLDEADP